jgi:hypothetical protein
MQSSAACARCVAYAPDALGERFDKLLYLGRADLFDYFNRTHQADLPRGACVALLAPEQARRNQLARLAREHVPHVFPHD